MLPTRGGRKGNRGSHETVDPNSGPLSLWGPLAPGRPRGKTEPHWALKQPAPEKTQMCRTNAAVRTQAASKRPSLDITVALAIRLRAHHDGARKTAGQYK